MAGTASGLESSSSGRSSGVDRSSAMTWNTTPQTTVTVGSHRAAPTARTGRRVLEHQREEHEPPDEARVTQRREELPGRDVVAAQTRPSSEYSSQNALQASAVAEPQERPAGWLVGRPTGHHHADQPAGDHRDDHRHLGRARPRSPAPCARATSEAAVPTSSAGISGQVTARARKRLAGCMPPSWQPETGLDSGSALIPEPVTARSRRTGPGSEAGDPASLRPRSTPCLSPKHPPAPVHVAPSPAATKVAAAAAALLGVSLFMTVAVIDVPHEPSDQELLHLVAGLGQPDGGRHLRACGPSVSRSRSPWS